MKQKNTRKIKGAKYDPKDEYFHKAKSQGFVARSAFKLSEIHSKHKIFKRGQRILDMGCAPGSWLQFAAQQIGVDGKILGIDLDPVRVELPQVLTLQMDLYDVNIQTPELLALAPVDVIQSDAMTKTTGIVDTDCARSIALVEYSVHLAKQGVLKKGGQFLAKVFEGPGFTEFYKDFRLLFEDTSVNRPPSIRPGSREVYVYGRGFKLDVPLGSKSS